MKKFAAFVRKEFYHILRDKRTMLILLAMPIIMIILFGFALSTEVRNVNVGILTPAPDNMARQIADRLDSSPYFSVVGWLDSPQQIEPLFRDRSLDMVVVFGQDFSSDILSPEGAAIQLVVDAVDANMAQSYTSYSSAIIGQYFQEILPPSSAAGIQSDTVLLYNPQMKSAYNFVPGIMGLILMLICAMMTSIAIVREKEMGTMEVLLVSPIRPVFIILAKMVPYFTISCFNLVTILLLSVFALNVPVAGSLVALGVVSLIYIFTTLALGLLVSTFAKQQVVAMLFSGMLLMVPTILLSGMVFPVESMPEILQWVSTILPPRWYIAAVRKMMIQGLPFVYVIKETAILAFMALVLITVAFKKFNDRLE